VPPPRFCQLARARLEGARIEPLEQVGMDRVFRLRFATREQALDLVGELFGPTSNLYLVERGSGRILDRLRASPPPRRLAAGIWAPPAGAAGEHASVLEAAAADLEAAIERAGAGADAAPAAAAPAALMRALPGLPPGVARLAVELARETSPAAAATALAGYLAAVARHEYRPGIVSGPDGATESILAPIALPAGWSVAPLDSLSDLVGRLVEAADGARLAERRQEAMRAIVRMRRREEERERYTRENIARAGEADQWERWGNLLKSSIGRIQPFRDRVEVVDYYDPAAPAVTIPLKPALAPRQNVERCFTRAKKLRRTLPALESRLAEHGANLSMIEELARDVAGAAGRDELSLLEARLASLDRAAARAAAGAAIAVRTGTGAGTAGRARGGRARARAGARAGGGPLEFVSTDGLRILVGRNNAENDLLSRKLARKHDLWLHARDLAGAHVVVRLQRPGAPCPARTLEEAAQLAAHYSKGRHAGKVEVMHAPAGSVKKPPGSPAGQVVVEEFRTLWVRTDPGLPARLSRPL
jgi:predicted ribosome quality control (RQC) complex YloA/Tae2 family protein